MLITSKLSYKRLSHKHKWALILAMLLQSVPCSLSFSMRLRRTSLPRNFCDSVLKLLNSNNSKSKH